MTPRRLAVVASLLLAAAGCSRANPGSASADFFEDRASHPTELVARGPAPGAADGWPEGAMLRTMSYASGSLSLRGVVASPHTEELAHDGKSPVLVYLHDGFALRQADVDACEPFLAAGFVVWAPALRGESGNPGDHELLFGELDDARAAVAAVPRILEADPSRIVVLGFGVGGELAAMLSLYADLPAVETASIGGTHGSDFFDGEKLPFADGRTERRLRLFAPYVKQMKHPHYACAGSSDFGPRRIAEITGKVAAEANLPFEVHVLPAAHEASVGPCMQSVLGRVLPKVR